MRSYRLQQSSGADQDYYDEDDKPRQAYSHKGQQYGVKNNVKDDYGSYTRTDHARGRHRSYSQRDQRDSFSSRTGGRGSRVGKSDDVSPSENDDNNDDEDDDSDADADDTNLVLIGTPIDWDEVRKYGEAAVQAKDSTRGSTSSSSSSSKALVLAQSKNALLKPEDQMVFDEQGRRRFHGAFTGGFSAGYYNTVGSKEGWTPSTFVSSRDRARAAAAATVTDSGASVGGGGGGVEDDEEGHGMAPPQRQQRPEDYMDAEDMEEFGEMAAKTFSAPLGTTSSSTSLSVPSTAKPSLYNDSVFSEPDPHAKAAYAIISRWGDRSRPRRHQLSSTPISSSSSSAGIITFPSTVDAGLHGALEADSSHVWLRDLRHVSDHKGLGFGDSVPHADGLSSTSGMHDTSNRIFFSSPLSVRGKVAPRQGIKGSTDDYDYDDVVAGEDEDAVSYRSKAMRMKHAERATDTDAEQDRDVSHVSHVASMYSVTFDIEHMQLVSSAHSTTPSKSSQTATKTLSDDVDASELTKKKKKTNDEHGGLLRFVTAEDGKGVLLMSASTRTRGGKKKEDEDDDEDEDGEAEDEDEEEEEEEDVDVYNAKCATDIYADVKTSFDVPDSFSERHIHVFTSNTLSVTADIAPIVEQFAREVRLSREMERDRQRQLMSQFTGQSKYTNWSPQSPSTATSATSYPSSSSSSSTLASMVQRRAQLLGTELSAHRQGQHQHVPSSTTSSSSLSSSSSASLGKLPMFPGAITFVKPSDSSVGLLPGSMSSASSSSSGATAVAAEARSHSTPSSSASSYSVLDEPLTGGIRTRPSAATATHAAAEAVTRGETATGSTVTDRERCDIAARSGHYGPQTRRVTSWQPAPILCDRLGFSYPSASASTSAVARTTAGLMTSSTLVSTPASTSSSSSGASGASSASTSAVTGIGKQQTEAALILSQNRQRYEAFKASLLERNTVPIALTPSSASSSSNASMYTSTSSGEGQGHANRPDLSDAVTRPIADIAAVAVAQSQVAVVAPVRAPTSLFDAIFNDDDHDDDQDGGAGDAESSNGDNTASVGDSVTSGGTDTHIIQTDNNQLDNRQKGVNTQRDKSEKALTHGVTDIAFDTLQATSSLECEQLHRAAMSLLDTALPGIVTDSVTASVTDNVGHQQQQQEQEQLQQAGVSQSRTSRWAPISTHGLNMPAASPSTSLPSPSTSSTIAATGSSSSSSSSPSSSSSSSSSHFQPFVHPSRFIIGYKQAESIQKQQQEQPSMWAQPTSTHPYRHHHHHDRSRPPPRDEHQWHQQRDAYGKNVKELTGYRGGHGDGEEDEHSQERRRSGMRGRDHADDKKDAKGTRYPDTSTGVERGDLRERHKPVNFNLRELLSGKESKEIVDVEESASDDNNDDDAHVRDVRGRGGLGSSLLPPAHGPQPNQPPASHHPPRHLGPVHQHHPHNAQQPRSMGEGDDYVLGGDYHYHHARDAGVDNDDDTSALKRYHQQQQQQQQQHQQAKGVGNRLTSIRGHQRDEPVQVIYGLGVAHATSTPAASASSASSSSASTSSLMHHLQLKPTPPPQAFALALPSLSATLPPISSSSSSSTSSARTVDAPAGAVLDLDHLRSLVREFDPRAERSDKNLGKNVKQEKDDKKSKDKREKKKSRSDKKDRKSQKDKKDKKDKKEKRSSDDKTKRDDRDDHSRTHSRSRSRSKRRSRSIHHHGSDNEYDDHHDDDDIISIGDSSVASSSSSSEDSDVDSARRRSRSYGSGPGGGGSGGGGRGRGRGGKDSRGSGGSAGNESGDVVEID